MSWRKTRTLLKPSSSAHPSSRSIVTGSKVSACHISSWLIAVLGDVVAADQPGMFAATRPRPSRSARGRARRLPKGETSTGWPRGPARRAGRVHCVDSWGDSGRGPSFFRSRQSIGEQARRSKAGRYRVFGVPSPIPDPGAEGDSSQSIRERMPGVPSPVRITTPSGDVSRSSNVRYSPIGRSRPPADSPTDRAIAAGIAEEPDPAAMAVSPRGGHSSNSPDAAKGEADRPGNTARDTPSALDQIPSTRRSAMTKTGAAPWRSNPWRAGPALDRDGSTRGTAFAQSTRPAVAKVQLGHVIERLLHGYPVRDGPQDGIEVSSFATDGEDPEPWGGSRLARPGRSAHRPGQAAGPEQRDADPVQLAGERADSRWPRRPRTARSSS